MDEGIGKYNVLFSDIEKTDLSSFCAINYRMFVEHANSGNVCFECESFYL
jgi:hypothetical protein